ncbi:3'-5' exoribonuclease YhaM family protein [Acetobacterium woodii]|uniref:3'-5' exoribonuclease YhaM n=1 Tax=Acetobacterium woodii (strain ATCC 29683 / DSM 1030 / JCM 2381 / KCTC 1655 / WB1) TaxID=931626 RepID=H6LB44_ACEWD|nr:HD domain-containing protein [Acetobacterium woodii]AFA47596.1 3'-5' exoribonuclease YhaM [Acetobacterium woodii DSM 1030]
MKIKSVQKGQDYLGFLFIKSQMTKTATNGSRYFNMVLNDADFDEIDGKKWDVKPEDEEIFTNGKLVKIKGKVQEFNNRLQLIVERMRLADDRDDVNIDDYIETVPVNTDEMLGYINDTIDDFQNKDIAAITKKIFNDQTQALAYFPAAKKHHHAIKGGLLYHLYTMLKIGKGLAGIYPFINRELLYAGIILHDIGKINEMVSDENGAVSDYTPEGKLLGHITQEIVELELVGTELGTDPEVLMLLKHMILSHHYQPEFGSPKRPMFPEAELLHHIDMIDARMYTMEQALNRVEPGSFTEPNWSLDGISLYRRSFE